MKIVVLDGYTENPGDLSWEGLEKLGDLTVYDRTPKELVAERMQGAEAVFTNKTVIREEDMAKCPTLRFIGVLATGYNIVDLDGARKHQSTVSNVPAYSTRTVAQFTMALLLEMCDHVGEHSRAVKEGEWSNCIDFCFWKYPLIELAGKILFTCLVIPKLGEWGVILCEPLIWCVMLAQLLYVYLRLAKSGRLEKSTS